MTDGVTTEMTAGSLLLTVRLRPPAGAGCEIVIATDAVALSTMLVGPATVMTLLLTVTARLPCTNPLALARRVVLPAATPLTVPVPSVPPCGIVTVPPPTIPSTPVLSDDSVTTRPPVGAGFDSVTRTSAVCPTPTS